MRNYTTATVWGIPIKTNISLLVFLLILAWIIGSGTQIETYVGIVNSFAPMLVLLSLFIYGAASSESRTVAL